MSDNNNQPRLNNSTFLKSSHNSGSIRITQTQHDVEIEEEKQTASVLKEALLYRNEQKKQRRVDGDDSETSGEDINEDEVNEKQSEAEEKAL